MIRVFLADDHGMFRDGVKRILSMQSGIRVVGEAETGAALLRAARAQSWDVLLLDMDLGDTHGLEALKQIKQIQPACRILVLTMYGEDQYAIRAYRAGADGYISKGSRSKELVDAVQIVYAEGFFATPKAREILEQQKLIKEEIIAHEQLSDREYEIFLLSAEGKSPSDIAKELKLVMSTVSTYRKRVVDKLGLKNASEMPHYAMQHGLLKR